MANENTKYQESAVELVEAGGGINGTWQIVDLSRMGKSSATPTQTAPAQGTAAGQQQAGGAPQTGGTSGQQQDAKAQPGATQNPTQNGLQGSQGQAQQSGGTQATPGNAKLNKARANNKKIVTAFKDLGLPVDKLVVASKDKNGRNLTKASDTLNKLRKTLFGESLEEDNDAEFFEEDFDLDEDITMQETDELCSVQFGGQQMFVGSKEECAEWIDTHPDPANKGRMVIKDFAKVPVFQAN